MKEYLFDEGETFVIDGTEFGGFDPKIAVFNPKFLSKEKKNDELIEKDISLMPVSFIESEDIYFFKITIMLLIFFISLKDYRNFDRGKI